MPAFLFSIKNTIQNSINSNQFNKLQIQYLNIKTMELPIIIIFLGGLIFFSHLANGMFDRTKIPNVLLLLLIGIILGPISGVVKPEFFGKIGRVFTNVTLIVILFESGTNLKFEELKKAIGRASILTLINFIATMTIATFLVNLLTKLDWMGSIFVGAIIGGTSSAVVIPMVKQLKVGSNSQTILFLESVLSDVLCLVIGLAVLEGMELGVIKAGVILSKVWKAFLFAALIGIAAGLAWSFFLSLIRSLENSMFITPAFVFILYGLVEYMGYNGGIAAIGFGIILGNNEFLARSKIIRLIFRIRSSTFNQNEKNFFSEIVFILQTYFFVYVGLSIQFGSVQTYLVGLIIVSLIILARAPVTKLISKRGTPARDITISSILTPKGLVTAVMASLPLQMEITHGDIIQDLGYSIVLFSILTCSILVILISKDPFIFKRLMGKDEQIEDGEMQVEISEEIKDTGDKKLENSEE